MAVPVALVVVPAVPVTLVVVPAVPVALVVVLHGSTSDTSGCSSSSSDSGCSGSSSSSGSGSVTIITFGSVLTNVCTHEFDRTLKILGWT